MRPYRYRASSSSPIILELGNYSDPIHVANLLKYLVDLTDSSFPLSIHSKAKNMLRPHLGYPTQAGSLNQVADADCLEQIQQLLTRLVMGLRHLPYEEQLRRLGLCSLGRRHICGDFITAYKVFN